jgi:hypothetical protein
MNDTVIHNPEILQNYLIEIIGETVESQGSRVRRIAAKEIDNRYNIIRNANDGQDLMIAALEIANLSYRLASPSIYFAEELLSEPEPYSADGILFPALVDLVHIEEDLFTWGWLPEQVRALGLANNPGDELAWPITREFVTFRDRYGYMRTFHRLSS